MIRDTYKRSECETICSGFHKNFPSSMNSQLNFTMANFNKQYHILVCETQHKMQCKYDTEARREQKLLHCKLQSSKRPINYSLGLHLLSRMRRLLAKSQILRARGKLGFKKRNTLNILGWQLSGCGFCH